MAAKAASKSAPKKSAKSSTTTAKAAAKPAPKTTLKTDPVPAAAPTPAPAAYKEDSFVPIAARSPWGILALVLGIIGLGGVGTILAGIQDGRHKARDITIGILQIVILFAGSLWGLVWGILIFIKSEK